MDQKITVLPKDLFKKEKLTNFPKNSLTINEKEKDDFLKFLINIYKNETGNKSNTVSYILEFFNLNEMKKKLSKEVF